MQILHHAKSKQKHCVRLGQFKLGQARTVLGYCFKLNLTLYYRLKQQLQHNLTSLTDQPSNVVALFEPQTNYIIMGKVGKRQGTKFECQKQRHLDKGYKARVTSIGKDWFSRYSVQLLYSTASPTPYGEMPVFVSNRGSPVCA